MTDDLRTCPGCGYQTTENLTQCPQCQRGLMPARQIRRLGWVLLVIGLFLLALMGTITFYLAPSLLQPGRQTIGGSRFNGTAQQGISALMLFGAVMLFGLTAFINGLWQIRTGQRNQWLLYAVAAAGLILLGSFWSMYTTFG